MKILSINIFSAVFVFLLSVCAIGADNNVNDAVKQYTDAVNAYKKDAENMSSNKIYEEINRNIEMLRIKQKGKESWVPDITDKEQQRSAAYIATLEKRRNNKDPDASFYYGLYEMRLCMGLSENKEHASAANATCNSVMESLKIAANANDPRAMKAIGIMYKEGFGVAPSKYVAADWLVKSAKQYIKENSRENALSTIEEAVNLVPDHPGALKIKKQLLQ